MNDITTISAAPPTAKSETRQAIAHAAAATGTDFSYLLAQAKIESSLDPHARAATSSASGLFQFIDSTWLNTLDRHGSKHGMTGIADAIQNRGGRASVSNPAQRAEIMALRFDPQASSLMAGALAGDNRVALQSVLGRDPDAAELYLAHFLGERGATKFLTAMETNPASTAASVLPRAAAANKPIFYEPSGAPRSLTGVMEIIRGKIDAALQGEGELSTTSISDGAGASSSMEARFVSARSDWQARNAYQPMGRSSVSDLSSLSAPSSMSSMSSMSDILRDSFGADASPNVRTAYGKLKAFGL